MSLLILTGFWRYPSFAGARQSWYLWDALPRLATGNDLGFAQSWVHTHVHDLQLGSAESSSRARLLYMLPKSYTLVDKTLSS